MTNLEVCSHMHHVGMPITVWQNRGEKDAAIVASIHFSIFEGQYFATVGTDSKRVPGYFNSKPEAYRVMMKHLLS